MDTYLRVPPTPDVQIETQSSSNESYRDSEIDEKIRRVPACFENATHGRRERDELFSKASHWVPQYMLEGVLRTRAVARPGVRIEFGDERSGIEQDKDGNTAHFADRPGPV